MTRFVLTLAACEDLRQIVEHGLETLAQRFQNELEQTFLLLADNPALGFNVRFFVKGPAVIAYRWEARPIEVLRVIVGSLDLMR